MADGDLITDDYQFEYNGLLLGAGTPYETQQISNLASMRAVRSDTDDRFGRHGGIPGKHFLPVREMVAQWDIFHGSLDLAMFRELRDAAQVAFAVRISPDDVLPLVYKLPGADLRRVYCRPLERDIPVDTDFALGYGQLNVRLECADPFIYANDLNTIDVYKTETTGGFDFPAVFPLVFGTGGSSSGSVVNGGTAPAFWEAIISGAVDDPVLSHIESGRSLEFDGLDIAAGETLVINSKDRTIMLNGTASRRSFLAGGSQWFDLQPGLNTIGFNAEGTPTGHVTFTWRDQYWSE